MKLVTAKSLDFKWLTQNLKAVGENSFLKFTGKEHDSETNMYYYGARYLDPLFSRWVSTDPAFEEYLPVSPMDDGAKRYNSQLPGQGRVFNPVNFAVYNYGCNNPLKYLDPNGLKNYIIIATFPGGGNENVGTLFLDAANTRAAEIKNSKSFDQNEDKVTVFEIDSNQELIDIINKGDIDYLEMFGHGGAQHLVIGSRQGPGKREYFTAQDLRSLRRDAFNTGATINVKLRRSLKYHLLLDYLEEEPLQIVLHDILLVQ